MTEPNMSKITASLERDLQNFSLNNDHHPQNSSCSSNGSNAGAGDVSSSDLIGNHQEHNDDNNNTSETAYEFNSHIRMPYHWEQCLDLKSGELYYINWKTGMKSKEDPRTRSSNWNVGVKYDSVEFLDESSYESEGSTTEESSSSPSTTSEQKKGNITVIENENNNSNNDQTSMKEDQVLVVAGCKSCFMYFMVLKQVEDCPKCTGQLIHFASP